MRNLAKRGLKIYFKDIGGVFFSLLGVIIIFCLYIFFIGDSIVSGLEYIDNVQEIMNSWVIAGMLASAAITTSMGAYSLMVNDKERKTVKDFYSSPLKKSTIAAGYMMTGFLISVLMSVITFVFGEIYIVVNGGSLLSALRMVQILGVILLSSFASSAIVCFIIAFVHTVNAYTTISIILGTLIGFLIGAYVPIGELPNGVQTVIRCFPCAHAASLFRQIMMAPSMEPSFASLPAQAEEEFTTTLGVVFHFGETTVEPWMSILFLLATGVVFYLLAILVLARKSKK